MAEERGPQVFHEIVFHLAADGAWSRIDGAWERVLGRRSDLALATPWPEHVHPDDHDRFGAAINRRAPWNGDVRFLHADGEVRWLAVQLWADDDGCAGSMVDVTDRRRLEQELAQSQKLESVGRLAAGIAHEINTPIQFVGDNLRFLEDAFRTLVEMVQRPELAGALTAADVTELEYLEAEVPDAVAQALDGVDRVATIVRAMKAFGHPDTAEQRTTDINEALRVTVTVARNELKYVADVETDFGELPDVTCYPGDLNQVFLNLLVNASHAITERVGPGGRGTITIRTRLVGPDVVVSIGDDGAGIPEAVRSRVFDPFFTTKDVGVGTGQGLSLARSVIVERHRGRIWFDTETGHGTTFHIQLPVEGEGASKPAVIEEPTDERVAV